MNIRNADFQNSLDACWTISGRQGQPLTIAACDDDTNQVMSACRLQPVKVWRDHPESALCILCLCHNLYEEVAQRFVLILDGLHFAATAAEERLQDTFGI